MGVLQQVTATQLFALELNPGMPDSCAKARLTVALIQKQPTLKKFFLTLTAGFSFLSRTVYLMQFNKMFLSTNYIGAFDI